MDPGAPVGRSADTTASRHDRWRGLLLHTRPVEVQERTLRLALSWGLGGAALLLVLVLLGTGLMLKFVFEPSPERAYDSILLLRAEVPFGQLVRNLHRWSGNLLLLAAFLHLLRVYYTGAIDRPRRVNWLIGTAAFALAVLANFTGYLLPWDQISYWAVTISASMLEYLPFAGPHLKAWVLGGSEPDAAGLMNFYVLHTAVLPVLLVAVLPFHFWRVRAAGGLVVPRAPEEAAGSGGERVSAVPHLVVRELAFGLILLAMLLLFSILVDAPLGDPANPGLSPNPTKAPWYFMGLQELLLHFHPLFSVLVIPAAALAALLALPWMESKADTVGVWFRSRRGRKLALASAVLSAALTLGAVWLDEAWRTAETAGAPGMLGRGVGPLLLILFACATYAAVLRRAFGASRAEWMQSLFTVLITAFVVLTLVGVWFRGPGMQLGWAG